MIVRQFYRTFVIYKLPKKDFGYNAFWEGL